MQKTSFKCNMLGKINRVFTRSSKRPAIRTCILNTFAGRLLDRVNGVLLIT